MVRILADGYPLNPGHCLIIPRRHFARWSEASPAEKQALLESIDRAQALIQERHPADAFNVGWNDGKAAGQTVGHFHIHVVPRIDGDVPDPRGGVRWVIPSRAPYWRTPHPDHVLSLLDAPHAGGLVSGESDPLLPHLASCFARAKRVDIAVAFVMRRGVELVRPHLEDFMTFRGSPGHLRLLTGDYLNATDPDGLEALLDLGSGSARCELRVFEAREQTFHPKSYIFHLEDGTGVAFVGSSNLSQAALQTGVEWNYRIVGSQDLAGFDAVVRGFEALFAHGSTRPLTHDWIAAYRQRRIAQPQAVAERRPAWNTGSLPIEDAHIAAETEPAEAPPAPHEFQEAALMALRDTRSEGNTAGLVVLATGLGKTWLAAFDSQPFARVLFVAHREEILDQAIRTFRRIRPDASIGRFTGSEKTPDADVLFASVQTLGKDRHLQSFRPDHFDYIVVDEFHHAAATTYRNLIEHFDPRFLLGLTATPERTDGADLLRLCGHNLVYSANLGEGIRSDLLSPLHYVGVPDDVDYANIPWRSSRFDEQELTKALATQERARNALEQFKAHAGTKALGFCCSRKHADFMAEYFNSHGKRAAAVHSGETSAPRTLTMEALQRGDLDIVFSVDMFNEGVDVPAIDTVLMLRPTESRIIWLQQLGRGLRKAEGKERLQVIDYIGNHRVFLNKPQALLGALIGLGEGQEALRVALMRLKKGELDLPPGCSVTYELVETILDELLEPTSAVDRLRNSYADFRKRNGRRPTAAEMHGSDSLPKAILKKAFGSWFGLVREMDDLPPKESAALDAAREFLNHLEGTSMTKSFKMLTLRAMLAADAVPGSIGLDELADRFDRAAKRSPLLRAEVEESVARHPSLRAMLRVNPVKAWADGEFFEFKDDTLRTSFDVPPSLRAPFRTLVEELIDWRLAEYLDRSIGKSFQCKVTWNQRDPILKLPERSKFTGLPEGKVPLTADGRRFEAHFAKIAINKITDPGQNTNELPGLLRGWFGPDAGKPQRSESVVCERHGDGYRMRPLRKQLSDPLKVHDDSGNPLDATFQVEQTGDAVSIVYFSRGGKKGTPSERNSDYHQGLELLLSRMARLGLSLLDAQIDTRQVTDTHSSDQRRLQVEGRPYPVELASETDIGALRKLLGSAQAKAGRAPGARGSGNSTKQIRLTLGRLGDLDPGQLSHQLAGDTRH